MKISDILLDLIAQKNFYRTQKGRSVNDRALKFISAALDDKKNYGVEATKCLNCGIILSSILVSNSCPNCGNTDLTTIINRSEIIRRK